ncbi:MAG TPA: homogentisate 1,2-dioxygenase [Drouetiella sp.]
MKKTTETGAQTKTTSADSLPVLQYQSGFGNHFETEAVGGALPKGQNSPQRVAHGLYAEQLSGSSFTANRHENLRSWLYRIRPSVLHSKFKKFDQPLWLGRPFSDANTSPEQLRWDPLPAPKTATDFVEGVATICGNGDGASWRGSAIHIYSINRSMENRFFYNADGEMLFVPESGALRFRTEFGDLDAKPGEIAVVPKGIKFQIIIHDDTARGYICENYGQPFKLPTLGVIGSNGLANPRDFLSPVAKFEHLEQEVELVAKFNNRLWTAQMNHSPLDVVAWHGNYAPYKYDLSQFQVVNTVSFDHSDPSIFTVLTSASEVAGFANIDFVIFPPRWLVAERTFRPPYYHRNMMSEYMGLVFGVYDAKEEGFVPGGGSLHNCMSAHGPDFDTFEKASKAELAPKYLSDTLAFMFESSLVYHPTEYALNSEILQRNYLECWSGLKANFKQP